MAHRRRTHGRRVVLGAEEVKPTMEQLAAGAQHGDFARRERPGQPFEDASAGPRSKLRRHGSQGRRTGSTSAGAALLAMLVGFFVAGLLDAGAIEKEIEGKPLGTGRTVQLALLKPMVLLSETLRLDRPAVAVNAVLGRSQEKHHTIADVAPAVEPKWPRGISAEKPLRLLILGDSMAQALGPSVRNLGQQNGMVRAKLDYKVSSGLSRPDFYNWPQRMIDQLVEVDQDATIVMFGANDAQDFHAKGKVVRVGTEAWRQAYRSRVARAMKILTRGGRRVYWVGNPIMRDSAYAANMREINMLYKAEAERREGVVFIDSWSLLVNGEGRFSEYLRDTDGKLVLVRAPDGIHFTRAGADLVATHIIAAVARDWSFSVSGDGEAR